MAPVASACTLFTHLRTDVSLVLRTRPTKSQLLKLALFSTTWVQCMLNMCEAGLFQAGRHQSKQKPVETNLFAKNTELSRKSLQIAQNSANVHNNPLNTAQFCRMLWKFAELYVICDFCDLFLFLFFSKLMFRLVFVLTGGVPLQVSRSMRGAARS